MYTRDLPLEERISITNDFLKDTIQCQKIKMEIADERENHDDYIKAYELSSLCEQIKEILDGDYDMTEWN